MRVEFCKFLKSIYEILVIFGKTLFTIICLIVLIVFVLILSRGCGSVGNPDDLANNSVTLNNYLN
jgi:hypothetical protein